MKVRHEGVQTSQIPVTRGEGKKRLEHPQGEINSWPPLEPGISLSPRPGILEAARPTAPGKQRCLFVLPAAATVLTAASSTMNIVLDEATPTATVLTEGSSLFLVIPFERPRPNPRRTWLWPQPHTWYPWCCPWPCLRKQWFKPHLTHGGHR